MNNFFRITGLGVLVCLSNVSFAAKAGSYVWTQVGSTFPAPQPQADGLTSMCEAGNTLYLSIDKGFVSDPSIYSNNLANPQADWQPIPAAHPFPSANNLIFTLSCTTQNANTVLYAAGNDASGNMVVYSCEPSQPSSCWLPLSSDQPGTVASTSFAGNNTLFVSGGASATTQSVYKVDLSTNQWISVLPSGSNILLSQLYTLPNQATPYIVEGQGSTGSSDMFLYDPTSNQFQQADTEGVQNVVSELTGAGSTLYATSKAVYSLFNLYLNIYNTAANQWATLTAPSPPSTMMKNLALSVAGSMVYISGEDNSLQGQDLGWTGFIYSYDVENGSWDTTNPEGNLPLTADNSSVENLVTDETGSTLYGLIANENGSAVYKTILP